MMDKQTQIIEAAIGLFAKDGISVPTAKIAKEAGVSNGTLFNYFATKQDLIDEVYLGIKREVAECVLRDVKPDQPLKEMFFIIWRSYVFWAKSSPLKTKVASILKSSRILSPEAEEKVDEVFQVVLNKMDEGIARGEIRSIPTHYLCELANAQLGAAISYAEQNKVKADDLEDHICTSFQIYWNGIKA